MTKIAVLGLTGILLAMFLKDTKPQFAVFVSMATCILIFFYVVEKLLYLSGTLKTIQSYINLKSAYFDTLMKIVGITYVADFSASLCKDAGYGAIAGQIEFFGKISVLALGTPVLLALFETIQAFLN
ncbi:MAG: stage III sporulation protein AD [Firmicutes bacterium]|nr:stage III sporulation protein AD [Lachnospiraceae bacterium]MDD6066167.1 stage III sporulation protein AD [Bacillota bacterium]MDY2819706.1 stage III sporulation protein AD [Hominisplanchenecus sp.]